MPVSQQLDPNNLIYSAASAMLVIGVAVMMSRAVLSNPIPWEAKKPLIEKYGLWAVNRAESFCPHNDVACVAREAKRLYEVYTQRRGT
jgi:hypothetical protein